MKTTTRRHDTRKPSKRRNLRYVIYNSRQFAVHADWFESILEELQTRVEALEEITRRKDEFVSDWFSLEEENPDSFQCQ